MTRAGRPRQPVYVLTAREPSAYRHALEGAIAFSGGQHPVPPVRADLQAALDDVRAGKDERARLAASG